jgi:hypothetical protein
VADCDPAAVAAAYDASEALFARLSDEARRLREWAALAWAESGGGREALEAAAEARCRGVADFEENLRGLKASWRRGRAAAALSPDSICGSAAAGGSW